MKCPKCTGEMNQLFTSWYCNYCEQRSKRGFTIPIAPAQFDPPERSVRIYKDDLAPGGFRYVNDPNDSCGTAQQCGTSKPTSQLETEDLYKSLFPAWGIIRKSPGGGYPDECFTLGIRRRDKDTNVLWGAWGYWDASLFFTDQERDHLSFLTQIAQPLAEGRVGFSVWREEHVKYLVEKCNPNRFAVSLGRATAALCNTIEEEALKK